MLSNSRISWRRGTSLPQPRLSSRGLSPGPNALAVQAVVETLPLGIAALDQSDFPAPGPLLHGLLALYRPGRSEEHTSDLQSLMPTSYPVFCLKKKNNKIHQLHTTNIDE